MKGLSPDEIEGIYFILTEFNYEGDYSVTEDCNLLMDLKKSFIEQKDFFVFFAPSYNFEPLRQVLSESYFSEYSIPYTISTLPADAKGIESTLSKAKHQDGLVMIIADETQENLLLNKQNNNDYSAAYFHYLGDLD